MPQLGKILQCFGSRKGFYIRPKPRPKLGLKVTEHLLTMPTFATILGQATWTPFASHFSFIKV